MSDPHTFTAIEEHPNGIRVITRIVVPAGVAWRDVRDCAELAQMAASRAMSTALSNKKQCEERAPF